MTYYSPTPQGVRGASRVHTTREEKDKMYVQQPQQMTVESDRQATEARFLVPKVQNFVETRMVSNYLNRVMLWVKAGYPVHVIGPTGCGKTALAMKIAEKLGKPMIWINGDEDISTTDLIGGYSKIERRSVSDRFVHNVHKSESVVEPTWVENPLALACKYGYTLIYNEFSRAKPEANNVLLAVLEEGILELPTKFGEERYIEVHPDFNLILTSNNIEYAGVHRPQDALLDRMAAIYMDYYDEETEVGIVQAHSNIPIEKTKEIVKIIRGLRGKLAGATKPGTRPAIMIAQGLEVAGANVNKEFFEQLCVDAIASKVRGLDELPEKTELIKNLIANKDKIVDKDKK